MHYNGHTTCHTVNTLFSQAHASGTSKVIPHHEPLLYLDPVYFKIFYSSNRC